MERSNPWLGLRKLVPVILAVFMALGAVAAHAEERQGSGSLASAMGAPVHRKYVKDNGDGTYDLTLSVTGDSMQSSMKRPKPVDVIMVLDRSSSMLEKIGKNSNTTRWDAAKKAAESLTKRLLTTENAGRDPSLQNRMAVVTFDVWGLIGQFAGTTQWTTSVSDASVFLWDESRKPKPHRGTNWESAWQRVNDLLYGREARSGVDKHVVFLTEGGPTFRTSPREYRGFVSSGEESDGVWWDKDNTDDNRTDNRPVYGGGVSDFMGRCYRAALAEARKRGNAKLFAVGVGDAAANATVKKFAHEAGGEFFDGGNLGALEHSFDKILEEILDITQHYRGVSLKDELSDYVRPVNDKDGEEFAPRLLSGAFDASNASVGGTDAAAKNMRVWYDGKHRTLRLDFTGDSQLTAGVTYWVTLTIAPTKKAQNDYVKSGGKYPHVGDTDTDAPDRSTSSGKPGFYANAAATLSYKVVTSTNGKTDVGKEQTVMLAKPVVQVQTTTVTLIAKVDNTHAGSYGAKPSDWLLSAMDANGRGLQSAAPSVPVAMESGESGTEKMATQTTLVTPGSYKLSSTRNPDSTYPYFAGYMAGKWFCTDDKGNKLDATNPSVADEVTVRNGQNVTCVLTYTSKPGGISWTKVDERGTRLGGSGWSLAGPGGFSRTVTDNGEHDIDKATGGLHVAGLHWGEYTLTETKAPDGYQKLGKPLTVKVLPTGDADHKPSSFTVKAGDGGRIVNRKVGAPGGAGLAATGAETAVVIAVAALSILAAGAMQLARRRR